MTRTLLHLQKAFGHSMKGLRETFRNEMAFRIELTAAVILIPTAPVSYTHLTLPTNREV